MNYSAGFFLLLFSSFFFSSHWTNTKRIFDDVVFFSLGYFVIFRPFNEEKNFFDEMDTSRRRLCKCFVTGLENMSQKRKREKRERKKERRKKEKEEKEKLPPSSQNTLARRGREEELTA